MQRDASRVLTALVAGAAIAVGFPGAAQAAPALDGEFAVTAASLSTNGEVVGGPDGNVWVTLDAGGAVARITPAGVTTEFPTVGNANPEGIAAGPDDNLWYVQPGAQRVVRMNPSDPAGDSTQFDVGLAGGARGIAAGPDGRLWIVDVGDNEVVRVNVNGTKHDEITTDPTLGGRHIALGPDGAMWVAGFGGKVARIPDGAAPVATHFDTPGATSAYGVAPGSDGNVWFSLPNNVVARVTPAGVFTAFPTPTAGSDPFGMVAAPDGNVWAAQFFSNSLGMIRPDGTIAEVPILPGSETRDVGAGADQKLYYTAPGRNSVGRMVIDLPQTQPPPAAAPPQISKLELKPKRFAVARKGKGGTRIRFRLSRAANVRLVFERKLPGRRKGKRCVAPKKSPKGKRCVRHRRAGAITRKNLKQGRNTIRFSGKLGGKALRPGAYRLTARPAAGGVKGAPRRAAFRVVKR